MRKDEEILFHIFINKNQNLRKNLLCLVSTPLNNITVSFNDDILY